MTKKDKALLVNAINEIKPVLKKYEKEIFAVYEAEYRKYRNAKSDNLADKYYDSYSAIADLIDAIDELETVIDAVKDILDEQACNNAERRANL